MLSLSSTAILPLIITVIVVSPAPLEDLWSRTAGQAGITTKVTSDNGTDLTSNFQTMVYIPAEEDLVNITNRDLSERAIGGVGVRAIDRCRSVGAVFRLSMCDYHDGHQTSMQRYLVQCSVPNTRYSTLNLRMITEWGACNRDEICVNGQHDEHGLPSQASCVSQRRFQPIPNYDTILGRAQLHEYLTGRMAMAVMSHPDATTPMAVENMEFEAGVAGSSRVGGAVGYTSQKSCDDCVQIASDRLAEGTDFLSTQVKVVGSVSAGIAGILWIAALSG